MPKEQKKREGIPACDQTKCDCPCHTSTEEKILDKQEIREILGKNAHIDYERNCSHYHCWHQDQPPACGIPPEKHTQCCLCDAPIPTASKMIDIDEVIEMIDRDYEILGSQGGSEDEERNKRNAENMLRVEGKNAYILSLKQKLETLSPNK